MTEAKDFSGGAWSAAGSGTILFGTAKGLSRVSAEGGAPVVVTELGQGETGHLWPSFLPDGHHYLYLAWSEQPANRAVFLGTLDQKDKTRLITAESNATFAASTAQGRQHPVTSSFIAKQSLFAQPFNTKTLAFTGDPAQIAGGMAVDQAGRGVFDVSQTGTLIYFQGASGGGPTGRAGISTAQFGFVDRRVDECRSAWRPGRTVTWTCRPTVR